MLYTAFLCVLSKVWRVGKLVILMIMRRKRIKLIGRDLKQYRIFFIPFSITGSETKIPSLDILWMSRPNKLLQKANKLIEPFRIFKHAFFCQVISLNPFSFFLLSLHITVTSPTGPATFFFFFNNHPDALTFSPNSFSFFFDFSSSRSGWLLLHFFGRDVSDSDIPHCRFYC